MAYSNKNSSTLQLVYKTSPVSQCLPHTFVLKIEEKQELISMYITEGIICHYFQMKFVRLKSHWITTVKFGSLKFNSLEICTGLSSKKQYTTLYVNENIFLLSFIHLEAFIWCFSQMINTRARSEWHIFALFFSYNILFLWSKARVVQTNITQTKFMQHHS